MNALQSGMRRAPNLTMAQASGGPPAPQQQRLVGPSRRQLLSAGLLAAGGLVAWPRPSAALDLEIKSIDLPPLPPPPQFVEELNKRNKAALDAAEESFQSSELLRSLKEKSEANKGRRKKELEDRYCRRQAELGVGDCGGLRYIPGATKSGVQERPAWLEKVFGPTPSP